MTTILLLTKNKTNMIKQLYFLLLISSLGYNYYQYNRDLEQNNQYHKALEENRQLNIKKKNCVDNINNNIKNNDQHGSNENNNVKDDNCC